MKKGKVKERQQTADRERNGGYEKKLRNKEK